MNPSTPTCWLCRCSGSRGGFTIVEVLVAMAVMGVGLVGVFGALRMANDATDRIRNESEARLLAEQHMVSLLARSAGELQPASGVEGRFSWEERVQAVKVADLARLAVVVKWVSRGRSAEFELVSLREMR